MEKLVFVFLVFVAVNSFPQTDLCKILEKTPQLELPYTDRIGSGNESMPVSLNNIVWSRLGLDSLEFFIGKEVNSSDQYNSFRYGLVGFQNLADGKLLFIQRNYTNESIHWTVIFKDGSLQDWLLTAYDNAEGFYAVQSLIEDGKITRYIYNLYSDQEKTTEFYRIASDSFEKFVPTDENM
ncbi:hypothetical protein CHISP_2705 [Chitinispirillum alkaliphilum]|nr:hypothetical protein CHISP_2705 [Chitinispirillum alkaliphilum]